MAASPTVTLHQAMKKNWLELWYQPKIDLATKRLVGAEGLIRVRHPKHGIMFPGSFLPGASEDDMLKMTEQVILDLAARLGGPCPPTACRCGSRSMRRSPPSPSCRSRTMLREERPRSTRWPGLIIEVTEDEIVKDLDIANEVASELRAHHCTLAIDDFGAGYSSLARLQAIAVLRAQDRPRLCHRLQQGRPQCRPVRDHRGTRAPVRTEDRGRG